MNEQTNLHTPSPEFRAALEREVVQAFRRQSQFSAPPSATKRARWRTVAALAIGLAVGAGGVVASAQVRSGQQTDSLMAASDLKRMMATMRLEIANATLKELMQAVNVGMRPLSDASEAQRSVLVAQTAIKRIDLEAAEIRISGAAARDELWAPLVGSRDFVLERLNLDALILSDRFNAGENRLKDLRERQTLGMESPGSDVELDARAKLQEARDDFKLLSIKTALRAGFLNGSVSEKELPSALQMAEVQNALNKVASRLQQAVQRAKRAKDRAAVGAATQLDVKRAELDELEASADRQRVQEQLNRLLAAQALKKKP